MAWLIIFILLNMNDIDTFLSVNLLTHLNLFTKFFSQSFLKRSKRQILYRAVELLKVSNEEFMRFLLLLACGALKINFKKHLT